MNNHNMKKKFGQNFLTDKNLLMKIVDEADINNKNVIEIGPGQGALTQFLVKQARSVVAYEVDNDLKPYLDVFEQENSNLKVVYNDILKSDFNLKEEAHVVANIPYNITSPIIFKIIDEPLIKSSTLMVQKEVAERVTASPGSRDYNALSVIIQHYMDVKKVMNVGRRMFRPVPKVDSAVFKMIRKSNDVKTSEFFVDIVKASFHQKRKTLANNLSFSFKIRKTVINEFLNSLNIELNDRAENISVEKFEEIAEKWHF